MAPQFHQQAVSPSPSYTVMAPQLVSPSPSASASGAWTQDFQRLSISSRQHAQPHSAPRAWHDHFNQNSQPPASFSHFQPPLPFQAMRPGLQTSHFTQQQHHQQQLPADHFDEAAFEAAFDAAMQHVSIDQDAAAPIQDDHLPGADFNSFLPDIHPHLPLFRLALADALVTNTDQSLHRAAIVVNALARHPRNMDPVQAMLLRPLLSALNDPKRTLFAQRYQYEQVLNHILDGLASQNENARLNIDANTEHLLASYVDLVWQLNESNHMNSTRSPLSTDNEYWLHALGKERSFPDAQNITHHSVNLLNETFKRQVISDTQSPPLSRLLDLEHELYSKRSTLVNMPTQHSSSLRDREAVLFDMLEYALAAPETVEALEASGAMSSFEYEKQRVNSGARNALEDYQRQLELLELQNQKRQRMKDFDDSDVSGEQQSTEVLSEQMEQDGEDQQESDRQVDDELAQTAANLLDRVSDNQSAKFKNSAFLGLMRQLADGEIRVEGDKMVPVTNQDGQDVVDMLKQGGSLMEQGKYHT
jgi:hypothetical protein